MTRPTTQSADRKREKAIRAATEMFATQGVAGTSMRMIAGSIDILPGSLYKYISSKDSLLEEIVLSHLVMMHREFRAIVDQKLPPVAELTQLITRSLELIQKDPYTPEIFRNEESAIRKLPRYDEIHTLTADNHALWIDSIERGVTAGAYRPDIDARTIYSLMRDGLWMTGRWFTPTKNYTLADLSNECVHLYLGGIIT
ncbi:TetR/AcrR family transcriptional regulator [Rhodococcus sp. RDE2]|uniref:TetR/AcrR family transcriptional regulator n=1 Tax=Rhodococcus sp. RDE2 TaxID=2885078 RepID=UPI001E61B073|nr:TetR/AcrR family transcriptional regulator [Rhodococcus sp. RDE2]BDB63444.1 hypothetical protein RDE2_52380 [Rhodococcus sp. RDE2]